MFARYLNAPLLLLLWQVAPVDIRQDEGGRVRISFGTGRGEYAFQDFPSVVGCSGTRPARTEASDYSSRGISVVVWAKKTIRLLAALGSVNDRSGERHGTFGAAQAVFEQKYFGVGLGLASFGGPDRTLQPSGSARIGPLDGISVRADYRYPQHGMGLIGGPRIGVGLNQGRSRKTRLFLGIATTPIPDSTRRVGGFAELAVPLGVFDGKGGFLVNGFVAGTYHGNEDKSIYSLGIGGWISP